MNSEAAPASTSAPSSVTRWQSLDVLRGVAILLVLFHHISIFIPAKQDPLWRHAIEFLRGGGWVGVDLFFVLSGFLISGILFRQYQKSGGIHLSEFLIRRGFKIYPQFWVMIGVSLIFNKHSGAIETIETLNILAELLFVQNYFYGMWSHTWSLAVEEHCYLALAITLAVWTWWTRGSERPFRGLTTVVVCGLVAALIIRCVMIWDNPLVRFRTHQMPTHARFDNFLCGALLGYWYTFHTDRFLAFAARWRWVCLAAGMALLLPNFLWPFRFRAVGELLERNYWITSIGLTVNWIAAACLLISALGFPSRTGKRGWLAWIGGHSYGIYLWHSIAFDQTVEPLLRDYFTSSHTRLAIYAVLYLVGTILVGAISSWLIERPALRLRDWLFPSSAGQLRGPAVPDSSHSSPSLSDGNPITIRAVEVTEFASATEPASASADE